MSSALLRFRRWLLARFPLVCRHTRLPVDECPGCHDNPEETAMRDYTPHDHAGYVPGCFRCDLSRDEADD